MYKFDNPVEHLWHDLAGGGEAGRVAVGAEWVAGGAPTSLHRPPASAVPPLLHLHIHLGNSVNNFHFHRYSCEYQNMKSEKTKIIMDIKKLIKLNLN